MRAKVFRVTGDSDSSDISPAPDKIDMNHSQDRALARNLMARHKRWSGMSEEFKVQCTEGLKDALPVARNAGDYGGVNDIVRTAAILEGQNQKDELAVLKAETEQPAQLTQINIVAANGVSVDRANLIARLSKLIGPQPSETQS